MKFISYVFILSILTFSINAQKIYVRYNQAGYMNKAPKNFIINADPLIPSDKNKGYLLLFGPQNSVKRIRRIIHILEKQVGAQFWVRKNPVKHAKKIPALEKAERDIVWLKQILKDKIQ